MKNIKNTFFEKYFQEFSKKLPDVNLKELNKLIELIKITRNNNNKLIIAGNGGSAAMASHVSVDLTKNAKVRAINFNEADLITCFGNDFGYENWIVESLRFYGDAGDTCIFISSSGKSTNIIKAAKFAKKNKMKVVTFSGFSKSNPLKKIGHLNFWVNSNQYNIVEMIHHVWLLAIVDKIIGVKI
jgi:D-sedoheptulose 7-phosphate isomerase